eukprot:209955-Prorocentrum_minimum.AAC.2
MLLHSEGSPFAFPVTNFKYHSRKFHWLDTIKCFKNAYLCPWYDTPRIDRAAHTSTSDIISKHPIDTTLEQSRYHDDGIVPSDEGLLVKRPD